MVSLLAHAMAMLVYLFAFVGVAHSHAVVLETHPEDGALLQTAPARIAIRFNEPVSLIAAQLLDANGREVAPSGAVTVKNGELLIALPPALGRGTYVASYRVVSLDGHPVGGSIVFSIGKASSRAPIPIVSRHDWGWRLAMVAFRVVLDVGILGGAGGVLFLFLVGPTGTADRSSARIAKRLALIGCSAAVLAIGVQGGLLIGGPVRSIAALATWRTGLLSSFGRTAVASFLGLGMIVAGLGRGSPHRGALSRLSVLRSH